MLKVPWIGIFRCTWGPRTLFMGFHVFPVDPKDIFFSFYYILLVKSDYIYIFSPLYGLVEHSVFYSQ